MDSDCSSNSRPNARPQTASSHSMRNLNTLTYLTVVLNFFIVIAAGHGIAFIGLLEIFLFPYISSEDFSFSLSDTYENSLGAVALVSLVGQCLLIFQR